MDLNLDIRLQAHVEVLRGLEADVREVVKGLEISQTDDIGMRRHLLHEMAVEKPPSLVIRREVPTAHAAPQYREAELQDEARLVVLVIAIVQRGAMTVSVKSKCIEIVNAPLYPLRAACIREGRAQDKEKAFTMQKLRALGYM